MFYTVIDYGSIFFQQAITESWIFLSVCEYRAILWSKGGITRTMYLKVEKWFKYIFG